MLTTSVIGSYAWPSWFITAVEAIKRGDYGPKDIEETLNDAVDLALRDQEDAGVDVISDGEMRRLGFFTADFYGRLTGLAERPPERRLGPGGHDQRERYDAVEPFDAPDGLGLVDEYTYVRARTRRPLKVPCPGPYTLAGRIVPGRLYADRMAVADRFAEIINAELRALVEAGVDFIQLDEPSYAVHKHSPKAFVDLFNQTVEGVEARIGLHLCFGNYIGRPVAHRTYAPLFPHILDAHADEIAMEFANREMAEVELTRQVVEAGKTVAAGLIDVKNYFVETPEIVAERIRKVLAYVPPDRLVVTPDCGLSQTARWAARAKLKAMVEGAKIVRRELG
ncbi:MAG: methionine synthase [Rhodothermales bacterium]